MPRRRCRVRQLLEQALYSDEQFFLRQAISRKGSQKEREEENRGKNLHARTSHLIHRRERVFFLLFDVYRDSFVSQIKSENACVALAGRFSLFTQQPGSHQSRECDHFLMQPIIARSHFSNTHPLSLSAVNAHRSSTFCFIELALNLALSR